MRDCDFRLTLIPHTQGEVATDFNPGTLVNLEVDVIARYLERLMVAGAVTPSAAPASAAGEQGGRVTLASLQENGFF